MAKPTLNTDDFDPGVLELFDEYVHSAIDRREFIRRASAFAVGSLTAAGLLDALNPRYAEATEVEVNDPRIRGEYLKYPSPQDWQGYLVRPAGKGGKSPGVLVIHENRGRNPYIEDVTRRLATEGFLAFAPDALSPFGGWPGNDDDGRALQRKLDRDEMFENFVAAFEYLKSHPECTGKVGVVGFCFGGGVVNAMAARLPDLAAGVPFYGRQAPLELVPDIKAALMIHNGELDKRVLAGAPAYDEALEKAGVNFVHHIYKGAHHGFHNNTTPRYHEESAKLAWERTIAFFAEYLTKEETPG